MQRRLKVQIAETDSIDNWHARLENRNRTMTLCVCSKYKLPQDSWIIITTELRSKWLSKFVLIKNRDQSQHKAPSVFGWQ